MQIALFHQHQHLYRYVNTRTIQVSKYTPSKPPHLTKFNHTKQTSTYIQKREKQKWCGNVNADFCCHRGTLDSAKVKTQSCIKPIGVPNSYQKCPILDRGGGILGESQFSHG